MGPYAASNPFRFATKYTDIETGLVQYNTRYYSPSLGRFINRDTIGEAGGLNLYAYVENDPVNRWDYLGMYYRVQQVGRQVVVTVPVLFDNATPEQRKEFLENARAVWGNGKPIAGTNVVVNIVELTEVPDNWEEYNEVSYVHEPDQEFSGRTFNRSSKEHGVVLINTAKPRPKAAGHEIGHILRNGDRYLNVYQRPDGTTYVGARPEKAEDKRLRSIDFPAFRDNIMTNGPGTEVTKENVAEILEGADFRPTAQPRPRPPPAPPISIPAAHNLISISITVGDGPSLDVVVGSSEALMISAEIKRKNHK